MSKTTDMYEAYVQALGYAPPSYRKELAGAKRLVEGGSSIHDMLRCYFGYKSQPFWRDKHLSLQYIATNINAWMQANDLHTWYVENNKGV